MPQPIDHHAKLLIGDLVLRLAQLAMENEQLREQLAQGPPPASPPAGVKA